MSNSSTMGLATIAGVAVAGIAVVGGATYLFGKNKNKKYVDMSSPPPWAVMIAGNAISSFLRNLTRSLPPPAIQVLEDVQGYQRSQMIRAAVELQLADIIGDGETDTTDMARKSKSYKPDNIFRLLRCLEAFGYFREVNGKWRNTPLSSVFRSDHPNNVNALVLHVIEDGWKPWGKLTASVQQDEHVARTTLGSDLWTFFKESPPLGERFARAMTAVDVISATSLVADYPWGRFTRAVDVAGSLGSQLARVLRAYPGIKTGVLFDLPDVAVQARKVWLKDHADLVEAGRLNPASHIIGGSFFDEGALPKAEDGDVYFLRNIVHDWDDVSVGRILQRTREAMGKAKATLALVEMCPLETKDPLGLARYTFDLHMQVMVRGKVRPHGTIDKTTSTPWATWATPT